MTGARKDRVGEFRTALDKNKKIIFKTQTICGICGLPVDMSLKYPDPMSKTVDHIIPIAKGGHPSDLENLQLAHRFCNRQKSDRVLMAGALKGGDGKNSPGHKNSPGAKTAGEVKAGTQQDPGNDNLPQHVDWIKTAWEY